MYEIDVRILFSFLLSVFVSKTYRCLSYSPREGRNGEQIEERKPEDAEGMTHCHRSVCVFLRQSVFRCSAETPLSFRRVCLVRIIDDVLLHCL